MTELRWSAVKSHKTFLCKLDERPTGRQARAVGGRLSRFSYDDTGFKYLFGYRLANARAATDEGVGLVVSLQAGEAMALPNASIKILMCGRAYETYSDEELSFRYLSKSPVTPLALSPNYNLSPTQNSPVLRLVAGERQFDQMRWQLVPAWEPAFTTKLSTINARSETVFESRLYRHLVVRRRCIVPLSGFYEWKKADDGKRPFKIHLRDEPIMSVAGIWDTWHPGAPEERYSFSIMTTAANEFMREIHDRMPVILDRQYEDAWLDPEIHEQEALQKLLKPCPSSWLVAAEISTLVNSPKNNTPAVLQPVAAKSS